MIDDWDDFMVFVWVCVIIAFVICIFIGPICVLDVYVWELDGKDHRLRVPLDYSYGSVIFGFGIGGVVTFLFGLFTMSRTWEAIGKMLKTKDRLSAGQRKQLEEEESNLYDICCNNLKMSGIFSYLGITCWIMKKRIEWAGKKRQYKCALGQVEECREQKKVIENRY